MKVYSGRQILTDKPHKISPASLHLQDSSLRCQQMHQRNNYFMRNSQINKGCETGSGWVPGWENRREWGSKSVGQGHSHLQTHDLPAGFLSVSVMETSSKREKMEHRPAWPKPSQVMSGEPMSSFRRLPVFLRMVATIAQTPLTADSCLPQEERKKLELSGSKRKQSILEKNLGSGGHRFRSSSDNGPTCFNSENLWCAGVQAMNWKLKAETQGFWEVHCLVIAGGDKCRHWATSSCDGTQRWVSSMFSIHPLIWLTWTWVHCHLYWFWAIH